MQLNESRAGDEVFPGQNFRLINRGQPPKGSGIAPGQKSPLVVMVTEPDGKVLVTDGQGRGKAMWKDLTVTASVVTANQKGIVSLPRDPRVSEGKEPHVTVRVSSHPGIHAELDVPIRYDYHFTSNFSGSPGSSGSDGTDGADGASGSWVSSDPNDPSQGGDCSNGDAGSDGQQGEDGGNAPPVQVRVTLKSESHPLLQVSVSAAGKLKLYVVDPQGGSLTVKADGGPEGRGEGVAAGATKAPAVWEYPADGTGATVQVDGTARMGRRGRAEASP